ncbi:MAG: hypothetical protein HYS56_02370, partial [Candidatus Omnitrophica bacterium]|nr:hypothetical protein [Candidatus Omnitrophota bacterium]
EEVKEKISTQELTPQISKAKEPAKVREKKVSLSPPALLDHTEVQATVNYLNYQILPGRGVRFQYHELPYKHMGHEWFLKRSHDLRGKTLRINYRGYVPREMTFKIAKSGTSSAVVKKVKLEDAPHETRSIFIEIPSTIPFKEVKFLEFWIERESAGRSHGDFVIENVAVIESTGKSRQAVDESPPEPFPFDRPFVPTNLMRAEVQA